MKISLQQAVETINTTTRTLQRYLENDKIHTPDEIKSFIRKEGGNEKRMLTQKGYDMALKEFGERMELVDNDSEIYLKAMIESLSQDKQNLNEQVRIAQNQIETTNLLTNSIITENEDLKARTDSQIELLHEKDLEILELKHQIELSKNKSLLKRIFNK